MGKHKHGHALSFMPHIVLVTITHKEKALLIKYRNPTTLAFSFVVVVVIHAYMVQFAQFGLNLFKWGQKHFSQLHLYLDPDKLESFCVQFNQCYVRD